MVTGVTSLTGNGLRDWFIQRISSIVMAVYCIFLLGFIICHRDLQYEEWQQLFSHNWMRIASLLVLLSLILHAWIGMWRVTTDYLVHAGTRLIIQVSIILALLVFFVWGIEIVWGI